MPSKRQRRRREKSRRHDYEYVLLDDRGNELETLERPAPANGKAAKTGDKPAKKGAATTRGRGRAGREIQPPSWRRVRNRALIFAPVMFVVVWLLGGAKVSPAGKLIETVFLLGFFLPFSYAVDALAYRSYRKRLARD